MMKTARTLMLAVATVALIVPASAGASQLRSFTEFHSVTGTTVPGAQTGLILKARAPVTVRGFGAVCPFGDSFCPGPNGDPSFDTTGSSFGGFVLPGAPAWGLIARAGNGEWTQIGSGPTKIAGTGELQFAVNDDLLTDNAGGFLAVVSYDCYPGNGNGDVNHYHCGPPGQN